MKDNCSAFTLAELLIVVAIVGTLIGIAVPAYYNSLHKIYQSKALANARMCMGSLYYASQNGDNYTPPAGCTSSSNPPSCTCTVSGFAGSVTCTLSEDGSVSCN